MGSSLLRALDDRHQGSVLCSTALITPCQGPSRAEPISDVAKRNILSCCASVSLAGREIAILLQSRCTTAAVVTGDWGHPAVIGPDECSGAQYTMSSWPRADNEYNTPNHYSPGPLCVACWLPMKVHASLHRQCTQHAQAVTQQHTPKAFHVSLHAIEVKYPQCVVKASSDEPVSSVFNV